MAALICCNLTEEAAYGYAQVPMDVVKHHDLVALPWAGAMFPPPYLRPALQAATAMTACCGLAYRRLRHACEHACRSPVMARSASLFRACPLPPHGLDLADRGFGVLKCKQD